MNDKTDREIMQQEIEAALAPEQEPVEIGTEWTPCVKLPVTVHVRQQRPGETHVSTREGITPVKPDDLIMRGVSGEEYPIGREIFERTYHLGEAHTNNDKAQPLYTAPQQRKPLADEEKLIDLLEAARETFKKSPSGSECSQNAAYVHSVLETMLIKREWQGLTDEEIFAISKSIPGETDLGAAKRLFAREIEAKLKEKNT